MITRRESILGGLLTLVWGTAGCSCGAHADVLDDNEGCTLEGKEVELAFAASTPAQTFANDEKLLTSCGDKELDYAIAQTLARLTKAFGVMPGFAFMDGPKSNNAWATPATKLKRADGSVFFGLRYLATKLKAPEAPDAWVACICAHEFGHILQYKRGLKKTLLANQPTVKRLELHADFLAGYFAGLSKLRNPDYPAAVFAVSRHAGGDLKVEDKGHHGTPDERAGATVRGFEAAYREKHALNEAVQMGVRYVSRL